MEPQDHFGVVSKEQLLFWQELVQLKADACYIRDYRDQVGTRVTTLATVRAIASTGSIALWAVWRHYAYVWAIIIATAQVADALKNVFPLYKKRKALSQLARSLNRQFVDAQRDWDDIASGICTTRQIRKLLHRVRLRKQLAEARFIPNGLAEKRRLVQKAQAEAAAFFMTRYTRLDS